MEDIIKAIIMNIVQQTMKQGPVTLTNGITELTPPECGSKTNVDGHYVRYGRARLTLQVRKKSFVLTRRS